MNTEQEKRYIVEQRALGRTFVQIGKDLGKTEDSIRLTFNRVMNNGIKTPKSVTPKYSAISTKCKYCGKILEKIPKGEKRQFCSAHCRNSWWNEKKRRTPYQLTCEYCGRRFVSFGNPDKRFCSRKCFAASRSDERQTEVLHD